MCFSRGWWPWQERSLPRRSPAARSHEPLVPSLCLISCAEEPRLGAASSSSGLRDAQIRLFVPFILAGWDEQSLGVWIKPPGGLRGMTCVNYSLNQQHSLLGVMGSCKHPAHPHGWQPLEGFLGSVFTPQGLG